MLHSNSPKVVSGAGNSLPRDKEKRTQWLVVLLIFCVISFVALGQLEFVLFAILIYYFAIKYPHVVWKFTGQKVMTGSRVDVINMKRRGSASSRRSVYSHISYTSMQAGDEFSSPESDVGSRRRDSISSLRGISEKPPHIPNTIISGAAHPDDLLELVSSHLDEFDTINKITVLYRLAKFNAGGHIFNDPRMRTLLESIYEEFQHPEVVGVTGIVNLFWSMAKLRNVVRSENDQTFIEGAIEVAYDLFPLMQGSHVVAVCWGLSWIGCALSDDDQWTGQLLCKGHPMSFRRKVTKLFLSVSERVELLADLRSQELANLAVAFCRVAQGGSLLYNRTPYKETTAFLVQLSVIIRSSLHEMDIQQVANALWSFSKMGALPPIEQSNLFKEISLWILKDDLCTARPQDLANVLWAYARASNGNREIFRHVGKRCMTMDFAEYIPQDFSNLIWAHAALGIQASDLFEVIAVHAPPLFPKFRSQELSNLLWGFAKGRIHQEIKRGLFDQAFSQVLSSALSKHSCQALVNIVYSSVRAEAHSFENILPVIEHLLERMKTSILKPQELSNMSWVLAKTNLRMLDSQTQRVCSEFIWRASSQAQQTLGKFKPQELSNLLWAVAKNDQIQGNNLFENVVPYVHSAWSRMRREERTQILWTFNRPYMPALGLTDQSM